MFKPLLLAAAVLTLGGLLLFAFNQPDSTSAERSGTPIVRKLDTGQLARIEIAGAGGNLVLVQNDAGWVEEESSYPAQVESITQLFLTLTATVVGDQVTDNLERHERFQLLAPPQALAERDSEKHATSLRLLETSGAPLLSLLAGKSRDQGQGQYIRFADDSEVYLIPELLSLSEDQTDWLDTELLNLDEALFRSIRITQSNGEELHLQRADENSDWQMDEAEQPLKQSKISTTVHRVKSLSFEQLLEVDAEETRDSLNQATRIEASLVDQRTVVIELGEAEIPGGEHAFRLSLTMGESDNATVQNSVRALQARIRDRVFSIRAWQARDFLKKRNDFYESE